MSWDMEMEEAVAAHLAACRSIVESADTHEIRRRYGVPGVDLIVLEDMLAEIRRLREEVDKARWMTEARAAAERYIHISKTEAGAAMREGARRMQEKCLQQDYPAHSEAGMHWLPSRDELLKRIRALNPEDVL